MGIFDREPNVGKMRVKRDVNGIIRALRSREASVRVEAADSLGEIKDGGAVEPLIKALGDEDEDVRLNAQIALGKIGEPAVEALIQALQEGGWDVRCGAAGALGEIGNKRAVGFLIQALEHDEVPDVRWRAAQALGNIARPLVKLGYKKPVKSLIEALGDKDWTVQQVAAEALGDIGDPMAIEPLIEAWGAETGVWAAPALAKIGEPALPALIKALKDRDENVRLQAAFGLGCTGHKRTVEPLIHALKDKSLHVRSNAAEALQKVEGPPLDPLIESVKDEDKFVRSVAASCLGRAADKRAAAEPLIQALEDESQDVRYSAARALGKIGDMRAVEPLIDILEDRNKSVRAQAAEALGEIGDVRAIEPLIRASKRGGLLVQEAAKEALTKLKGKES